MKLTTRDQFGYSKPSATFLMKLSMDQKDMSWFKWEDMPTVSDEDKLKLKRREK